MYFHNKLYRGNRSTKMNSASFEAFRSPNLPPLATVGIDINSKTNEGEGLMEKMREKDI